MAPEESIFFGMSFVEGAHYIPGDLPLTLDSIRDWALETGQIFDPDQVLDVERSAEIGRVCSDIDNLTIGISILEDRGSLIYLERPFMPIWSLINRMQVVSVTSWMLIETGAEVGAYSPDYGQVSLDFRISGSSEEFCSTSTAPLVINKFSDAFTALKDDRDMILGEDEIAEIDVRGNVSALFHKSGRQFDVKLTY